MAICPRCSSSLQTVTIGAMALDGCDSCGGLWFDAHELSQLAKIGGDSLSAVEQVFEPPRSQASRLAGEMQCPRCNVPLYEFEFKHTPGVTLDACPQCRGIWVDDRELEAIAQRMATEQRPTPAVPSLREKARQSVSFILRVPCPKCHEDNHASALVCWACGTALHGRRRAMLCPRCDSALHEASADGTGLDLEVHPRVDHCLGCGGIWVGRGALSLLMDLPVTWLEAWQESLNAAVVAKTALREAHLLCPVCQLILDERGYALDSGVYLDRCRRCSGTWLDQGELVLIRQVSMQQDVWGNRP